MTYKTYNPLEFWKDSWQNTPSKHPPESFYRNIQEILNEYKCDNVLELGCGEAYGSKFLKGYTGLDFVDLDKQYTNMIYADLTNPIGLSKVFDAVFSRMTLLHIPPSGIDMAVANIKQFAKKVIVLCEYPHLGSDDLWIHCFNHNLREKFVGSNVVWVDAHGDVGELQYK